MEFLVPKYSIALNGETLAILCECGAPADLSQSAEGGKTVWGYVCSKDGHALTDFVHEGELAAFQRDWRNRLMMRDVAG